MEDEQGHVTSSSSSSRGVSSSAISDGPSSSSSLDEGSSEFDCYCRVFDSSDASSFSPGGPLFEFSELMANLPIKRGLSRFYEGKSQSFTSLANVKTLEDLAKREKPYAKNLKACKRYGGGIQTQKSHSQISKKVSRNSPSNIFDRSREGAGYMSSGRLPPLPVQLRMNLN